MNKLKISALVMVLLLTLTGCQPLLQGIGNILYADVYDATKYIEQYRKGWQFQQLDTHLQEYYGSMYTAITDTAMTASGVEYTDENGKEQAGDGVRVCFPMARMSKHDITLLFEAFFRDNPQFFYLNREYRIEGRSIADSDVYYDTITLNYLMPLDERTVAIEKYEQALESMLKDVPASEDQYTTELLLYDRLAQHCTYDKTAASEDDTKHPLAYTAYGALVNGNAVCEGYAKAMQLLLNHSGIAATTISGEALQNNESHMWNLVTINGKHYFLDPTWNDDEDQSRHNYFNITAEMLSRTHVIEEENFFIPDCTATTDNYFVRNNAYIDTYKREEIAKIIADHVLDGKTTIQLQFSPKTFTNGLLFTKNGDLVFDMVNEHLKPHNKSLWGYTLWSDKTNYILTLKKS